MVKSYTFYDRETGAIRGTGTGEIISSDIHGIINGSFDANNWFIFVDCYAPYAATKGLFAIDATPSLTIKSGESIRFGGIPYGATVKAESTTNVVNDGYIEIEFHDEGEYPIIFSMEPQYIPLTLTVIVKNA